MTRPPAGKPPRPSALVLAAGLSSRFGGTKQLARVGGRTLVERAVASIPESAVSEVVVVVGHDAERVRRVLRGRVVKVVANPLYAYGIGSSIRAGLCAVRQDSPAVLIVLGDQPFLTRSIVGRVLRRYETSGGIVAVKSGTLLMPPAVFARKFFRELELLQGDEGARRVIAAHPEALSTVSVRSERAVIDVDTRADLRRARLMAGGRTRGEGGPRPSRPSSE